MTTTYTDSFDSAGVDQLLLHFHDQFFAGKQDSCLEVIHSQETYRRSG